MKRRFSLLLSLALLVPALFARDAKEQKRIDYLLTTVASAQGVKFIRNGSEYESKAAADHLRQKLNYAGDRLQTAEQFIQYCASESSISHRKYRVRLPDGKEEDSATYFTDLLRRFDSKP